MWSGYVWTWTNRVSLQGPNHRVTGLQHAAMQVIGVDPNLGDYDNRTALHLAASNGHLETITRMLEFGYLDAWWQEAHTMHRDTHRATHTHRRVCLNLHAYKSHRYLMRARTHTQSQEYQDLQNVDCFQLCNLKNSCPARLWTTK